MLTKILKIVATVGLFVGMLFVFLLCLLGNAPWLIIIGIVLLIAGVAGYRLFRSKIMLSTYFCVLLFIVIFLVATALYIGSVPRMLLSQERSDVLDYLELQYPGHNFRVVGGKAINSSLSGWDSFLRTNTFLWDEVEAVVEDENNVQFEVSGNHDWWNVKANLLYYEDNYSLIEPQITNEYVDGLEDEVWGVIKAHHYLFDGGDFQEKNIEISFIPRHIEAYASIKLNNISKSDFDESTVTEELETIRDAVKAATGFESVAINMRFYFDDENHSLQ